MQITRVAGAWLRFYIIFLLGSPVFSLAQENAWTKSTSGTWEELYWSSGSLPASGQSILLTNAGQKTLSIVASTAQNHASSLNVDSITVSSPASSLNRLFLNYSGFQTPLTVNALRVGSSAGVTLVSSWIQFSPGGAGLSVGGEFNQNLAATVTGSQLDVGYIGPGIYYLRSGLLDVDHIWIGTAYAGRFLQSGGTNSSGIVHLDGSTYELSGGDFSANVYFNSSATFRQTGGRAGSLSLFNGTYALENGLKEGNLAVPVSDGYCFNCGSASAIQSGGTNRGNVQVGGQGGGSYALWNGAIDCGTVRVTGWGSFQQHGGTIRLTNSLTVDELTWNRGEYYSGSFALNSGLLSAASITIRGGYTQAGGTNSNGGLTMAGARASFTLNGGLCTSANVSITPSWIGGFYVHGGLLRITNQLTLGGSTLAGWQGINVAPAAGLVVSNISLLPKAKVYLGTLTQSGLLTLSDSAVSFGSGPLQLGQLQPAGTNVFSLPASTACTLRVRDSHSLVWSNDSVIIIENWSVTAGHHIFVGANNHALTANQLRQVQFRNPQGTSGLYPASILSSGEIVPVNRLACSRTANGLVMQWAPGQTLQTATNVAGPYIDLSNGGTSYTNSLRETQRFYRLRLN